MQSRHRHDAGGASAPSWRRILTPTAKIILAVLLLSMFLKIPTLHYPHQENDEIIYMTLAKSLLTRGAYTLQGTDVLSHLSPTIYDHPLFNHPPLYPELLIPFLQWGDIAYAVLISWFGHMLAICGVGLVLSRALRRSQGTLLPTDMAFWLPLLCVCADPLQIFVARKLWIEGILAGLFTMSAALLIIAEDARKRRALLMLSGTLLGLAALAKLSALALLPVYLYALHLYYRKRHLFFSSCCFLLLPVAVLTLPWFVAFYLKCGVLVPDWINPDLWSMERFPLMKEWASRPWYFYLIKLPLLIPALPLCLYCFVRDKTILKRSDAKVAVLFVLFNVAVLTCLGARGLGFQLRHLTMVAPVIYMFMHHALPARGERPTLALSFVICAFVGAAQGFMYLLAPNFDDLMVLTDFLVR